MNTTKLISLYFAFATLLLLASCGSRKAAMQGGMSTHIDEVTLQKAVSTTNSNRLTDSCLTARINFSADSGNKDFSVGGTLRMKRDDVIQITLVPLGIMEAGRLELTHDYIMIIDRMNHRYVKADYQDIPMFNASGVNFNTFQALFWNELFILDGDSKTLAEDNFAKDVKDSSIRLSAKASRKAVISFLTGATDGLIHETNVAMAGQQDSPMLQWQYADFTKVNEQQFPSQMKMRFNGTKPLQATIRLSNFKNDSSWETRTKPSNRYTQVSLETIINMVMNLSL